MTRFFLVVLFSIACPAVLLAETATRNNPPPSPGSTNTPANNSAQQRYRPIQRLRVHPTAPSTQTQQNKLDMENAKINRGKNEAADRYNHAMDAAQSQMVTGVAGASGGFNATVGGKPNAGGFNVNANKKISDHR